MESGAETMRAVPQGVSKKRSFSEEQGDEAACEHELADALQIISQYTYQDTLAKKQTELGMIPYCTFGL